MLQEEYERKNGINKQFSLDKKMEYENQRENVAFLALYITLYVDLRNAPTLWGNFTSLKRRRKRKIQLRAH